jgi:hypothetical protein
MLLQVKINVIVIKIWECGFGASEYLTSYHGCACLRGKHAGHLHASPLASLRERPESPG